MAKATKQDSKSGFTAAEREAMKARAEELRDSGRGGKKKADDAQACLDAIAAMPDDDRAIGERIHAIVADVAADLLPKTWYGMPAFATTEGKVVCFFKPASKFGTRYSTFGFNDTATLDDGDMWPTEYAVTSTAPKVLEEIERLVKKATAAK